MSETAVVVEKKQKRKPSGVYKYSANTYSPKPVPPGLVKEAPRLVSGEWLKIQNGDILFFKDNKVYNFSLKCQVRGRIDMVKPIATIENCIVTMILE